MGRSTSSFSYYRCVKRRCFFRFGENKGGKEKVMQLFIMVCLEILSEEKNFSCFPLGKVSVAMQQIDDSFSQDKKKARSHPAWCCERDRATPYSHVDTPVPVRSLKLSNVGSGQYLDGSRFGLSRHAASAQQATAGQVSLSRHAAALRSRPQNKGRGTRLPQKRNTRWCCLPFSMATSVVRRKGKKVHAPLKIGVPCARMCPWGIKVVTCRYAARARQ